MLVPNYSTWTKNTPPKKKKFSCQILEVVLTFIEMLVTKPSSHDCIYNIIRATLLTEIGTSSKYFVWRITTVANFADIIKIATILIKTTFKDLKRIINYVFKCNLCFYFLKRKLLFSGEIILMSAELKGCVTWYIFFGCSLAKFYHCRMCYIF